MTDPAACFGCGERFGLAELKEVGDAVFCRACLGRMLRRVDDRTASSVGPRVVDGPGKGSGGSGVSADRAPIARTAAADAPCFLCGEPLAGDAVVELRGFAICARCARGLVGEDPPAGESDAPPGDGPTGGEAAGPERAAAPVQERWTPGSGTEWCSRCGRPMPGPGSYVLVDGRPHCAGCAVARASRSGAASARPSPEDAPPADACDACDRLLGAAVPETQGFRLCAACRASDPELALALARARHQRRLARASRRILEGDDD